MKAPQLADVDLGLSLSRREYEERLEAAQLRLLFLQRHLHEHKRRAILAFEGWDAAGKGGAIRRISEKLDPRGMRVHAIGAPEARELGHHYLHRFWDRMPGPSRIAVFDRSWYGRVLVERVEGLCTPAEWKRAFREIREFERMLVDDGVPVLKFFLHISKREQLRRFQEREEDAFKRWKITPEDWRNRKKWRAYRTATDEMLERTHTREAPWHVIAGENKRHARIAVLETTLRQLGRALDVDTRKLPEGWHT